MVFVSLKFIHIPMKHAFLCLCTFFFLQISLKAQSPGLSREALFKKYTEVSTLTINPPYSIILYRESDCDNLKKSQIIRRISPGIAVIKTQVNTYPSCVTAMARANDLWKLSSTLEESRPELLKQKTSEFTITATDIELILKSLQAKKFSFKVLSVFKESNSALLKCNPQDFFAYCLPEPSIIFADKFISPRPEVPVPGYNRDINTINLIDFFIPGAAGAGITMGIKENKPNENDIDLRKRILPSPIASAVTEDHATVVAALAGGAGNSFYTGKGTAWKSNFFPSSFSNLFPDSSNLLLQKNVTVQSHAYGTIVQSFYGAEALSYDVQTNKNKNLVHLFSSGNRGTATGGAGAYVGIPGFANITGNFKMAKNVITVAAVDTAAVLAPFSSAGPLHDGRLGPQITALGPNGTSEAAALVTGAVAVLQQVYKDSTFQSLPPASLIKAILYTTAKDIGSKGIDFRSGYGLLDIFSAVQLLQQKNFDSAQLQQSQAWTKNLTVPAQAANLKITLAWTDTAASVNTNRALVNDLDLELKEINTGLVYKPWVLNSFPNVDSLKKLPVRKRDSLNTAEQVSIELPAAGQYQIKVTANQILTGNKQPFHIAYTWDTLNILRFTNPVHAGDIIREENSNLKIKWKTAVADTNTTGDLSVSFDNGNTWEIIGTDIKLHRQFFNWGIPDITAIAQLRMECPFGNFYSLPFVIAPLTKINVDYLCTDATRLSWQKNELASSYTVYALGDTAFIKPIFNVTDTFIVINRTLRPENIFAVEPIISSGVLAARSEAIDVKNQGVNCYYRTLLAEPSGDSIRLTLELSLLAETDSITFEKTDANGTVLRQIAKTITAPGQNIYVSYDNAPFSGTNFYRAKLWIAGNFVYTEIVSVIHPGKKILFLYPNPVTKGQNIKFLIKEKAGDVSLLVTDALGRVKGRYPMNAFGEIKTAAWASGIYFYKLFNTKGFTTESGKFIIQ